MGLFGEKEKCCICQTNNGKKQIVDGRVCWDCISLTGPFLVSKGSLGYKQNSKQDFYDAITKNLENQGKLQEFHETDNLENPNSSRYLECGDYIKIDDEHKWWYSSCCKPKDIIFNFSDIVDFEIVENGTTITETKQKGGSGVGRAVVGGALLGPAGAVVGAATKKKKTQTIEKELLSSMSVRVVLDNEEFSLATIEIIHPVSEVRVGSIFHDNMRREAEEIVAKLRRIKKSVSKDDTEEKVVEQSVSAADEIMKYKQLLDMGAITEEEFELKKKQLLGL